MRLALEKAFDYRGDVSLTLKDGNRIEGYIFDRGSSGPSLEKSFVRLFPKDRDEKIVVAYSDIARIEFTEARHRRRQELETWVKKYQEKKRREIGDISRSDGKAD